MRLEFAPDPGWLDLLPISGLNRDHRDEYVELSVRIREEKEAAAAAKLALLPQPEPEAPENPAVMPDPADAKPKVTLTRLDVRPIQDLILSWTVQGASPEFDGILPWTAQSAVKLPLPAWNILEDALSPYYDALNGTVPKAETTTPT